MESRPKLHYPNGRGRMESIRWALAAAGVEFDEEFLETRDQLQNLQNGECLLHKSLPILEIIGLRIGENGFSNNFLDTHLGFRLYGNYLTKIDMYVEGTLDLLEMIIMHPFLKPDDKEKDVVGMTQKAILRYFPVFEKILRDHGQTFLVGNQLSLADVILLQTILALEELVPNILASFTYLQEYSVKISNIPTIKKFLAPGSKKKPPPDDVYVKTVYTVFAPL
ncbi:PREDICTED: glutathione S-transferase A4-like [Elephantulus edwardii]|uniref:glutathione S-transferase A4-like n=1 Tax=Elephantulus edwardii TaxID=28737 RepID=UPI0003F05D79|nr:PREDICTED: glutathione S-transferase A4-like [Elephantulus edwardii]